MKIRHFTASMFERAAQLLRLAPKPAPLPVRVGTITGIVESADGVTVTGTVTDEFLDRLTEIGERAPKAPS